MSNIDISAALYSLEAAITGRVLDKDIPAPKTVERREDWPPDYRQVYAWRERMLMLYERDPQLLEDAQAWYAGRDLIAEGCVDPQRWAKRSIAFINHWCDTYDPRNVGKPGLMVRMPMVLFLRQAQMIEFVWACMLADASGLVEKSRDMGASWTGISLSTYLWLFHPGIAIGWGSNNLEQVDKIGEPDTIFEKMRNQMRLLPDSFCPELVDGVDLKHGICLNPENGAVVRGQGGRNIGRGGRSRLYFVDEAAHLEYPEAVESSLSENTRCRIDLSSVSGLGTVFHRTREAGEEWERGCAVRRDVANVFIMDWRDHPAKNQDWYDERSAYFMSKGLPQVVARELDRNYAASQEGVIILYEWVEAAVDAHVLLGLDDSGGWWGGLDVADTGGDTNALIRGRGLVVKYAHEWGERDPGATARKAFGYCRQTSPIELQYDAIGIGTNVKSQLNMLREDGTDVAWLALVAWVASAKVQDPGSKVLPDDPDPKSPTNKEFFENFKAQAWWNLGQCFYKTWVVVTAAREALARGEEYVLPCGEDELISLDSSTLEPAMLTKLKKELSQATMGKSARLKLVIDKAPEGAKSPNLADGLVMGRFPARATTHGRASLFGPRVLRG